MISRTGYGRTVLLMLAAGFGFTSFGLAFALPAHAQAVPSGAVSSAEEPDTPAAEAAAPDANDPDIKDLQLDWSQLDVDASTLMSTSPASKVRLTPQTGAAADLSWSSKDQPNGAAAVSVKQPVSPFWDARVGADMTVTRQPATLTGSELLSEKLANGGSDPQSSGTAWAAITAPGVGAIWDQTAVEARVDPSQEQSKLGTSLSKSLPLNQQYSLTLQNGYNVIQQGIIPVPGITGRPARNYATEQSAKLSVNDTGTSLIAGQTLSSTDDRWLRKVGAEQKLFGDVTITGTIGETPQGVSNKSLTAGFKRSW
jgi:hypothetical protein